MPLTLERVVCGLLPPVGQGGALSAGERATLIALADVLVDSEGHGISPEDVATNVETFLRIGRSRRAWRVRVLLRCIELSSLPRFRKTFRKLSRDERRTLVLEEWIEGGRLGRICSKSRNLVILGTYGDPRAAAKTGYVPVHRRHRFVARDVRGSASAGV